MVVFHKSIQFLKISICIPTYNSEKTIASVLEAAVCQNFPLDQIVVLDDGSNDRTLSIISDYNVKLVKGSKNVGRGAIRKTAIEIVDSDFILFCDSTNLLPQDFILDSIDAFKDKKISAVSGRISNDKSLKGYVASWRSRHLFKENFNFGSSYLDATSLTTYGTILRRSAVLDVGNFNPSLRHSEDKDLGKRLLNAGYKIIGDPKLVVYSIKKDSVLSVLERYWRWYGGTDEKFGINDYWHAIKASFRPMMQEDIKANEWRSAFISFLCPHYGFLRHLYRGLSGRRQKPT